MLIGKNSKYLLKQTRSKAKMYEYGVPDELHIAIQNNANELLLIAIAAIGDISAEILNNNPHRTVPPDKKAELEFASHYFDAFFHAELEPNYDQYYLLLGSIAYYFCDYIGSSKVMANMIDLEKLDLGCSDIEIILTKMLQDNLDLSVIQELTSERFNITNNLKLVIKCYNSYFQEHKHMDSMFIHDYRTYVYAQSNPRELLLTDAMLAILITKMERSALNLLPAYTELPQDQWEDMLDSCKNITELWPAQIRLGEAGVFAGNSAIIQMPTSSGKTTSISIAIRAAFLSNRTSIAVVVAPYRSLCREISLDLSTDFSDVPNVFVNEFSDILEKENIFELLESSEEETKRVMILTPEKLIYLLRQDIDIIKHIGLIIFDEAHMFDDASRGVHFELLMSTIILNLDNSTQKLLISAVVPNAQEINNWLTKGAGQVIIDNSIRATEKSVAIMDWEKHNDENYGYLYFIDSENHSNLDFFVPRVVEIQPLEKLNRKEKARFFPQVDFEKSKVSNNDMAIYLALKLNHSGGVAIFCGRKDFANGVLKRILEIEKRGIDISSFQENSINCEHKKIALLIKENYGEANNYYEAAKKGVFAHHRGISNGIRISIEYAMKESLISCIVCTSTLAQGVNLPIKYLIISNLYQSQEKIKVRDFHNLIGRAGRAGVYTEGTILLSESFVYSRRFTFNEKWRWEDYLNILDPENSESCLSQLLLLVRPIHFKLNNKNYINLDFYKFVLTYYDDPENYEVLITKYEHEISDKYPKKINQFKLYIFQLNNCFKAIESFLLMFLTNTEDEHFDIETIVENTFGYFLATKQEKERLLNIFIVVRDYLLTRISNIQKRLVFSRTLLGTKQLLALEKWVIDHSDELLSCTNSSETLQIIMPQLIEYSENKSLKAIIDDDVILTLASMWIKGDTYKQIHDYAFENESLIVKRNRKTILELSDIIEVCDEGFGYTSTLIINAISELLNFNFENSENTCELFGELNNRMRYGLPSKKSVNIYESGFNDRVVALKLATALRGVEIRNKQHFKKIVENNRSILLDVIADFPSIYTDRLENL